MSFLKGEGGSIWLVRSDAQIIMGDISGHPLWTYRPQLIIVVAINYNILEDGKWDSSNFKETILLFCWDEVHATSAVRVEWVYTWVESSVIAWKRQGILPVVKMTSSIPLYVQRSLVGVFSWLKNLQISISDSSHKEPGRLFDFMRIYETFFYRRLSFIELFLFMQLTVNIFQILKKINYSVTHCAWNDEHNSYNPK